MESFNAFNAARNFGDLFSVTSFIDDFPVKASTKVSKTCLSQYF